MTHEQEWKKERTRIRRFIREAEKRGFTFDEKIKDIKPPKTIRKESVAKLKGYTPEKLYEKATYQTETGETVTGTEGRRIERSRASKKGWETRKENERWEREEYNEDEEYVPDISYLVLNQVQEMIDTWSPDPEWRSTKTIQFKFENMMSAKNILNGAINSLGEDTVAQNLEEYASEVVDLVDEILYKAYSDNGEAPIEDLINNDLILFSSIVRGQAPTVDEAQNMGVDRDEAYNDAFEEFLNDL